MNVKFNHRIRQLAVRTGFGSSVEKTAYNSSTYYQPNSKNAPLQGQHTLGLSHPALPHQKISLAFFDFPSSITRHHPTHNRALEWLKGVTMSSTPYRQSYARFAPSLLNNELEIDRALAEIHAMA
jgi:hypothetical protein